MEPDACFLATSKGLQWGLILGSLLALAYPPRGKNQLVSFPGFQTISHLCN